MEDTIGAILRGRKFKRLVGQMFEPICQKYDLKQIEIEAMYFLAGAKDVTLSEVYRSLNLNKGHVSQAMDALVKKGYLVAYADQSDRRYVRFAATERGSELIREIAQEREKMHELVLEGISEQERQMMKDLASRVCRNIDGLLQMK